MATHTVDLPKIRKGEYALITSARIIAIDLDVGGGTSKKEEGKSWGTLKKKMEAYAFGEWRRGETESNR